MDAVAFLPFLLYRPSWRHKSLAAGIPRIFYSFFHIFFFFFNNTSNSLNKLTIWTTLTLVCFLILFSHIERFKTKIQIQKKNEKPEHGKGQKDETSPHTITPEIKKKKNFESHDMIIFLFPLFFFFLSLLSIPLSPRRTAGRLNIMRSVSLTWLNDGLNSAPVFFSSLHSEYVHTHVYTVQSAPRHTDSNLDGGE